MLKLTSRLLSISAATAIVTAFVGQPSGAQTAAAPAAAKVGPAEAEGIIFERQQLMTKLDEETKLLGEIVAGIEPAEKLRTTARSIATLARESVTAFEPQVPGGRAKPEVWTNHADYSQRMKLFAQKAEEMAKEAEAGNMGGVMIKQVV